MDPLTAFGLFAVTAMLVCHAREDRSHWFVLAFAGVRPRIGLRFLTGCLALRGSGSNLGYRRIEAVDSDQANGHFTTSQTGQCENGDVI
jgi:hypothetical protein